MNPAFGNPAFDNPSFDLALTTDVSVEETWNALWDLSAHTAATHLTKVSADSTDGLREGVTVKADTSLGPMTLRDPMRIVTWEPPRHAVLKKLGPWITGTITVRLSTNGDVNGVSTAGLIKAALVPNAGPTMIRWHQTYAVRFLPTPVARLLRPLVGAGYRTTLTKILAMGTESIGAEDTSRDPSLTTGEPS